MLLEAGKIQNSQTQLGKPRVFEGIRNDICENINKIISSAAKREIEPTQCLDLLNMMLSWPVEIINKHQKYIIKILMYLQEHKNDKLLNMEYRNIFDRYITLIEHGLIRSPIYDLPPYYKKDSLIYTTYTINKKKKEITLREEEEKALYNKEGKEVRAIKEGEKVRYSGRGHRNRKTRY